MCARVLTFINADLAVRGVTALEVLQEGCQHVPHLEQAVGAGWQKLAVGKVQEALDHFKAIKSHDALEMGRLHALSVRPEVPQPGLLHVSGEEV